LKDFVLKLIPKIKSLFHGLTCPCDVLALCVVLVLFGADLKMTVCHKNVKSSFVFVVPTMIFKGKLVEVHSFVDVVLNELLINLSAVTTVTQISLCLHNALLIGLLYFALWKYNTYSLGFLLLSFLSFHFLLDLFLCPLF